MRHGTGGQKRILTLLARQNSRDLFAGRRRERRVYCRHPRHGRSDPVLLLLISYSGKDQLFAERLYADLQARGVRCWFAPHDVQGGKKLHEQIDDAIRVHERLLLVLSPESIHSEWVKTGIIKASQRERAEKRRMLFPVRLNISYEELKEWECFDGDTGKDLAREIREYYIPDFSQWERPEKFKEEFEKLVRDLKKAESAK